MDNEIHTHIYANMTYQYVWQHLTVLSAKAGIFILQKAVSFAAAVGSMKERRKKEELRSPVCQPARPVMLTDVNSKCLLL